MNSVKQNQIPGEISSHKDLIVWKKSIDLVEQIYKITRNFPREETFGLTAQIKRAAISIPSNIAEGAGRKSTKELIQFLYISLGSVAEIETQLIIAKKLGFTKEMQRMLTVLCLQPITAVLMFNGLLKTLLL